MDWLFQLFSQQDAPWWGIPGVTASATVLGALVAYVSTRASDGRKTRNEDRRRWDEDIRSHCSSFLSASDQYFDAALNLKFKIGKETVVMVSQDERSGNFIKERIEGPADIAKGKALNALVELELIAPQQLYDASRSLTTHIDDLHKSSEHAQVLQKLYREKRSAVVNELRKVIKVVER